MWTRETTHDNEQGHTCPDSCRLTTKLSWLLIALLPTFAVTAAADDPDVVSPLVSYQFLDSLAEPSAQPNVVSPLVSYQYFDWPGDENLTFETSPVASYYFGGGSVLTVSGSVTDSLGNPLPGTDVTLQRYGTAFQQLVSGPDGNLPIAEVPAGNYMILVNKPGYTPLMEKLSGDAGGTIVLNLRLADELQPPGLVNVTRIAAESAIRPGINLFDPDAPRLKAFDGSSFTENAAANLNPARMTVVITHGWLGRLDDWATILASKILTNHALGAEIPNIVGWDWHHQANTLVPPIDEACDQGIELGRALHQVLGTGYSKRVHFIGHSLGTIVNANACDHVHGTFSRSSTNPASRWETGNTRPHVTLLDEAEVANVFGQKMITSPEINWTVAQLRGALLTPGGAVALDWKNPVPNAALWTDNYISLVGFHHARAVNVSLPKALLEFDIANIRSFEAWSEVHGYSHQWYRDSVQPMGPAPAVGFGRSFESALTFPPSGSGMEPGSIWIENLATSDPLDLKPSTTAEANLQLPLELVLRASSKGADVLEGIGNQILDGYEARIQWAGNIGGNVIQKTGQVTVGVAEKFGNLWDAALDHASDAYHSVNPDALTAGNLVKQVFRIRLSTAAPAPLIVGRGPQSSSSLPPQAWFTVNVPPDAGFLAFDFTVTGDPAEDRIACAIEDQNLFTLSAKFAPDGTPVSTDLLDVSQYAGQEVELYFGLVGGTSSGCEVSIDGVRFITIPTPKLAATVEGNQVILKWPAAATGWRLQRNESLAPATWEDVVLPPEAQVADGVVTATRSRTADREFFRLKRD